MAKRFTDTEKWKKQFFKKLTAPYKLFWFFLVDDCDHSGIWEVEDKEIIAWRIGEMIDLDTALYAFNEDEKRVHPFDGGRKWLLIPFVSFQYGDLNPKNKLHMSVRRELEKRNLLALIPVRGPLKGLKDKDKDKEKDKELDKEKETWFEELWKQYPNKAGKTKAQDKFERSVKTEGDLQGIREALKRYLQHLQVNTWKKPQDGKTWFNSWQDWVDWLEPEEKKNPLNLNKTQSRNMEALSEFLKRKGATRPPDLRPVDGDAVLSLPSG